MTPAEAVIAVRLAKGYDREMDITIGRALGWRVSKDEWWNWKGKDPETGAPIYDPEGDEWCIRRDGRLDVPCNEALPHFTSMDKNEAIKLIKNARDQDKRD